MTKDQLQTDSTTAENMLPDFDCNFSIRWPIGVEDVQAFWNAYEPWFKHRGYTLHPRMNDEYGLWNFPDTLSAPAVLPYADVDLARPVPGVTLRGGACFAYARDSLSRDVVFRIVESGSDEMAVYERLMQLRSDLESPSFPHVLPPVDIIKSPYNFSFVVTPMWGTDILFRYFETFRDLLHFMKCTLTGLAYLHNLRIAHRDISLQNMLINYYRPTMQDDEWAARVAERKASHEVIYTLFDYDCSIAFDLDRPLTECRLPPWRAWEVMSILPPPDIDQGEPDYDPFAFDVACLANIVLCYYWTAVPSVSILAPLLDKMTTHIISERFTAAQALQFLEDVSPTLTEQELGTKLTGDYYNGHGYLKTGPSWDNLPSEFVTKWGHYRRPPLPWTARLLRWICGFELGWRTVHYIRCKLRI